MKKVLISMLFLLFSSGIAVAQTQQIVTPEKKDQANVFNDLYCSYGIGSLYYYINANTNSSWTYTGIGTFILGYTRSMNKVIGVGFQVAYTPLRATLNSGYTGSRNYNYLQALARIKFQYLNRAVFAMYSGVAIGVAIDYYSESGFEVSNGSSSKQVISPAGQLTLLGFRVGRRAAFCGEFGIGTLSILNMGFSYKFGE